MFIVNDDFSLESIIYFSCTTHMLLTLDYQVIYLGTNNRLKDIRGGCGDSTKQER